MTFYVRLAFTSGLALRIKGTAYFTKSKLSETDNRYIWCLFPSLFPRYICCLFPTVWILQSRLFLLFCLFPTVGFIDYHHVEVGKDEPETLRQAADDMLSNAINTGILSEAENTKLKQLLYKHCDIWALQMVAGVMVWESEARAAEEERGRVRRGPGT
jgi:hypothetical protein